MAPQMGAEGLHGFGRKGSINCAGENVNASI